MEEKICPYPGLRPFNEEESIFFRGREEHIEKIIAQLEERKFVMLTGASGDGKSSLVYAGVIPNARAGFFKAKFNNWLITDFKPERTPLKNMASALADKLGYTDVAVVEKELGFGFSSLINLYKNSPYHLDYNSDKWKNANEADKKALKRKAANLFLLVDQFEEFFTNSENYHHGKASLASQAVANLLLETANIALAEDLPIYIICTMRSDYIGQCAAFRGLPEYIGFSQFFVPRLKRKEINQVVQEPAVLNGDAIANRLTETLINEIGEGFDQLPVLQHALNQIWKQADKGAGGMDLIHLAKLTGLPKENLPPEDVSNFEEWFETVPAFKKAFFKNPSLENVLNSHANELYETAHEYYNSQYPAEQPINKEEATAIIKTAFQCLTKIDNSRAVRNRMTLQEITNTINRPEITAEKVGRILDIFRLPGNTLIRPYIGAQNFVSLHPNDVLDITHESLIRNWDLLTEWGKEEYDNLLNYQDFNKQMQRWLNNGKSKGYLLPIGPLTFFEAWYTKCNPNKYWLARYDDNEIPEEEKLRNADETLQNAQEFIKLSARKLFFTRTVMKYGANRLLTIIGITLLAITCTYYYFDYRSKQNSAVIATIEHRGLQLLPSNKVTPSDKADFLINYERLHNNSFEKVLAKYNDTTAFDIGFQLFAKAENYDAIIKDTINPIVFRAINDMDIHLEKILKEETLKKKPFTSSDFNRLNEMVDASFFIQYYDTNSVVKNLFEKNLSSLHQSVEKILASPVDSLKAASFAFNESLGILFALNTNNHINLSDIALKLSPFEGNESKERFSKLFPKGNTWKISWNNKLANNGGYLLLAYAYSYLGKTRLLMQCLDTILTENKDYKSAYQHNFPDIIRCLISYNKVSDKGLDSLIQWYDTKTEIDYNKMLSLLMDQVAYQELDKWTIYNNSNNSDPNPHDLFPYGNLSEPKRKYIGDIYAHLIAFHVSGKDEHNLQYALYFKKHGISEGIRYKSKARAYSYFNQAFEFYKQISPAYLAENFTIGDKGSTDAKEIKRSTLFLYPAAIDISNTWNTYWIDGDDSVYLASYIIEKKLFQYFATKEDMEVFQRFLYMYYFKNKVNSWSCSDKINYSFYSFANQLIKTNASAKQVINKDFLNLVLLDKAFSEKDTVKAFQLITNIDQDKIFASGFQNQSEEYYGDVNVFLIKEAAKYLAFYGKKYLALKYIYALAKPIDRRNALINTSSFLQKNGKEELMYPYLDSLYTDIDKGSNFGLKLLNILGRVGSTNTFKLASNLIKDVPDQNKPYAMRRFISGISDIGYYYKAYTYIPASISSTNELELLNEILHAEVIKALPKDKNRWENIDAHYGENSWSEDENGIGIIFLN